MHMAQVIHVMIASPSDVSDARDAVYGALHQWNEANTRNRNVILLPLRWETSAVSSVGEDGQSVINSQLVDKADVLVAIFGASLGQQTRSALSGTAEEIQRATDAGKPVHLFFSNAPLAHDVNLAAVADVRQFKDRFEGLYGTFSNTGELHARVWQAIEHDIAQFANSAELMSESPPVDFLVQTGQAETPYSDSRGRLKHRTKRWVDLTNRGTADAENVTVEAAPGTALRVLWDAPKTVQHGQTRRVPVAYSLGTTNPAVIVSWTHEGETRQRQFDLD